MKYFSFSAAVWGNQPGKFCMTIVIAPVPKTRSKSAKILVTLTPLKYLCVVSSLLLWNIYKESVTPLHKEKIFLSSIPLSSAQM